MILGRRRVRLSGDVLEAQATTVGVGNWQGLLPGGILVSDGMMTW